MTILEAMARGIPVITTNISTMPEVLGENGVLVQPGDYKALAKNILNVLGKEKYDSIKKELLKFRQQLGPEGVYDRVAKRILEDNI